MDEVRDIIRKVALKHNDSGEASLDRLARLILLELKENDYEIVKSNSVLGGVIKCGCEKCTKEAEYLYCEDCFEELSDNISHGL